jgi:hydrogenase-1 operon protein HyaF
MDKSLGYRPGQEIHVVNLTLLPHTEEDLAWLDEALGEGAVTILSRGYGNCRITATAQAHVWRVQFYNSMDVLILDTFEVTAMPEVVLAAAEDLADSAGRLREVLEAIR